MAIFIGRNIAEESKVWLHEHRIDFVEQALIDIQLIEPDFAFFQKIAGYEKLWIITSKWAALWLQLHHKSVGFYSADSVFCLSEKQANVIRTFTDAVLISKEKNLQSLSGLVQQQKQNKLCVCLKGNRSLKASGLESVEVEVYQNNLTRPVLENEFEAYLFFSPSAIDSFVQGGNQVSENARIIVIGETTARKAKTVFGEGVIVSEEQSELATIQTAMHELQVTQ